jgi:Fe-S-cluster containining protein
MSDVRRFACTQCGKCCNRSPEVELSEAAALADVFVFRLMFRMYRLARTPESGASAPLFYEKKRLLAAHAARAYSKKAMRDGKVVDVTNYLMISALALDTMPGACTALTENRCTIHHRRPLGCRTVPLHYSRPEALAADDFDAFVGTPDYGCDSGEGAPVFLQDGRMVDGETLQARAAALALAERDRPWKEAIVRRMKRNKGDGLPRFQDLETNAGFAAMTGSMRPAWAIAVDAHLITDRDYRATARRQLATIERELARGNAGDVETLREMAAEYRHALHETESQS